MQLDRQVITQAARRLIANLSAKLRHDPDVRKLAGLRCAAAVDEIYRSKHYEG